MKLPIRYRLYWHVYAPRVRPGRPSRLHRFLLRWNWHLHPNADPRFRHTSRQSKQEN